MFALGGSGQHFTVEENKLKYNRVPIYFFISNNNRFGKGKQS